MVLTICNIYFLELSDKYAWHALGYADNFKPFTIVHDNVDRIDVESVSPEAFVEKYERPYKPVVIRGLQNNWRAAYKWTLEVYYIIWFTFSVIVLTLFLFQLENRKKIP